MVGLMIMQLNLIELLCNYNNELEFWVLTYMYLFVKFWTFPFRLILYLLGG